MSTTTNVHIADPVGSLEELLRKKSIQTLIKLAFDEDLGSGDFTTNAVTGSEERAEAIWIAKQEGVVAGLEFGRAVFQYLDPDLQWLPNVQDGAHVKTGDRLVDIEGSCRAILSAERIALNFVQRMSGIATRTSQFTELLEDLPVRLLDTRKTVPGLRLLDKYAVSAGGGGNHRLGLYDLAMVKENHIIAAGGITHAVEQIRKARPDLKIEVETTTLEQVEQALACNVEFIMLDNMEPSLMAEAVRLVGGRAQTEASGNISFGNIRKVAETGVNFISIGALTHSVEAFDISQKLIKIDTESWKRRK